MLVMKLKIRFLIKEDNTVIPFLIPETSVSLFSLQKVGSYNQDHLGKEDQGLNFFLLHFRSQRDKYTVTLLLEKYTTL